MPRFFCIILSFLLVFSIASVVAAKKRDTFSYESKTGNFKNKDDWFGNTKSTRKQKELENEKKLEAKRAEAAERQREIQENATRALETTVSTREKVEGTRLNKDMKNTRDGIKRKPSFSREIKADRLSLRSLPNYPTNTLIPSPGSEK